MRRQRTADFPASAPAANPVFFRTYSRRNQGVRESWQQVCDRALGGLIELGQLTDAEADLVERMMRSLRSLPSGRWLWVGGTQWLENPQNFSGAYNCTSTDVVDWDAFGLMMDLAMMGCGTGAVLERRYISQLPSIRNRLNVSAIREIGRVSPAERRETTDVRVESADRVNICAGDSRLGWVKAYQALLELSSDDRFAAEIEVGIDLGHIRPAGETLKGFGGMANPVKLPQLFPRAARILNRAIGRQLDAEECCLLIDEAAATIVAGNIRRSAGMRQFEGDSPLLKQNLWQPDENGNWRIDPDRDALRMANHTRVFHQKPSEAEIVEAVRTQYHSGEGAIQWAGEAIARGNADLISSHEEKRAFIRAYEAGTAEAFLRARLPGDVSDRELEHRLQRYGLNPCLTADTWVHTEFGARQIKELLGQPTRVYVNGKLFDTTADGFFATGVKPIFQLATREGYSLRLTGNHQVLKVTAQTQQRQYAEWVEAEALKPGDKVLIHNHSGLQPWAGKGNFQDGWLLGSLVGDGCFTERRRDRATAVLRYSGESRATMALHAIESIQGITGTALAAISNDANRTYVGAANLDRLAAAHGIERDCLTVTPEIERGSYEFYRGFLRGLFDASSTLRGASKGAASIRLQHSNPQLLEAVQRMLLRLGVASAIADRRSSTRLFGGNPERELAITKDNLCRFEQVVGFREPSKRNKLAQCLERGRWSGEQFAVTVASLTPDGIEPVFDCTVPAVSRFDANGFVVHNCGEIIGADFHCNLAEIHLNQLDPHDFDEQREAFAAGGIAVAALLNHRFIEPRYQYSRELDPIVGVSFTGLFDFCVRAFGVNWLHWWADGRPETLAGQQFKQQEREYLERWRDTVCKAVWEYCDRRGIKRPNRCTTVQPSGTKSLLSGASPGWHPPKAVRFIRRVTFRKNDPVALACIDYGYTVVPSQSDKDDRGHLLDDPFDPRCTEWLVEIPVAVPWADLPGADAIDVSQFSALAQFDFSMQVQRHYVTHNTSSTLELRAHEVEDLGKRIHQSIANDEGYISAALLARFDDLQTFPRLPFEPIDRATYERLMEMVLVRRQTDDFHAALAKYDTAELVEAGPAGCDSDKCMLPEAKPKS
ncbi:ribonucleoside-triphosphate reductase, adenosylcobalamin-dependent [Rubidibacter lacunae]|nr:ribonucleoside-triphosphate reductase, adenosylcobalamin-dependent [Rubidibacter lacunae]